MVRELAEELKKELASRSLTAELKENEPMGNHTTFRTGGSAALFIQGNREAAAFAYAFFARQNVPYFLLGRGSNLLVSDKGFDGAVISLTPDEPPVWQSPEEENVLIASGGTSLRTLASFAENAGLSGLEFAAGIPGTVGGGLVMNAGAYDGELKDVLINATVADAVGNTSTLEAADLDLSYRHSNLVERGLFVLEASFRLTPGDPTAIRAKMNELAVRRREKQPLEYPSAGSTFKRPEGYFAGKLIEDAGLRGYSVGGAQVSEKHCGFVINRDHATSNDIYILIKEIQKRVSEHSGVTLTPEIKFLGEFA